MLIRLHLRHAVRHRVLTQQDVIQHSRKMAMSAKRRLEPKTLSQDLSEGSEDRSVLDEQVASPSARPQQTRKGRRRLRQVPLASMTICAAGEALNKCKPNMSIQGCVELPLKSTACMYLPWRI